MSDPNEREVIKVDNIVPYVLGGLTRGELNLTRFNKKYVVPNNWEERVL